ncbi:MAG: T9SS type A sorting domain-containing protein [Bacteroides sp.]|nr:T9SS type A sorting domain-containing protein [Bacteroides sp.]
MNLFKTLAIAGSSLLMAVCGLQAQVQPGEQHPTVADTINGKAGKVVIFKEYAGLADYTYLSANGRFLYGGSDESADEPGTSFIYEIATGKSVFFNDRVVGQVIDFDNYVTSKSIVRDGNTIEYKTQGLKCSVPMCASGDLNVISMSTYIPQELNEVVHSLYTAVVFDGNGNLIDTMPHFEKELTTGHGSYLWGISADGRIGAGKSSVNGAFSNNSPAFWDRNIDKTFSLADVLSGKTDGTLNAANEDGTYLTGERNSVAIYVVYDKEAHTYEIKEILPEPGNEMSDGVCVENKVVLGFDQKATTDVFARNPWVYFIEQNRKVYLNEYLENLYGLSMEPEYPMFSPGKISKDANIITGTTYDNGVWIPYAIFLNPTQIYAMPRSVSVRQPRNTVNAEIRWQAALKGNYTIKEYKVYCDGSETAIGTIPATNAENYTYAHIGVGAGRHEYQVQAIYTDGGVSELTEKIQIQIIGDGECLPVRDINASIQYNRTVRVAWGLPSSIVSNTDQASAKFEPGSKEVVKHAASVSKKADAKYIAQGDLDRISSFNTNIESASAAVLVGDYLYVSDYRNNAITVFNTLSGAKEAAVEIPGLGLVYDMFYHNGIIYCVGYTEHVSEIRLRDPQDPTTLSLSRRWTVLDENVRLSHISYIKGENGQEDMLMLGGYDNIFFYKTDGSGDTVDGASALAERFDISELSISGSAYYKGRVYFANQSELGHTPRVEVFDFATGEHLFSSNLAESFPEIVEIADYPSYDLSMAGLTVGELENGTVVLECMTQPRVSYNYVATVEIESSPDISGYNVYRDGEKLNAELLQARHYTEDITEPGTYTYSVEVVSSKGYKAMSETSDNVEVEIYPIGRCDAPRILNVVESNEMAVISWEWPESSAGLVGFNIYRDGAEIANGLDAERFVDQNPTKGKHNYSVEAFYDNSCRAADTMEIEITFEGKPMPPAAVHVDVISEEGKTTNTHTVAWELPFFEEPMAMGYCGTAGYSASFDGTTTIYAVVGWTADQMDMFDDLYLVGVEFVLSGEVVGWNSVVYVDDKMVYNQPITTRQRPCEWVQVYFSKNFPMKQEKEIAVGYMVQLKAMNEAILTFDAGPVAFSGKSDLISPDGLDYASAAQSGVNANLAINALVVRQRDMEQAAKSNDPQAYIESKAMRLSSVPARLGAVNPIESVKSTSEKYALKGFYVYRDDEKLNDEVLTSMSFVADGMAVGSYTYEVSALYADGKEEKSDPVYVDRSAANQDNQTACPVAFYPNPVQDVLYIEGEYASLSLIDMTGRVVLSDIRNEQVLPMANFQSGIYFVKVTLANGQSYITKIVKK